MKLCCLIYLFDIKFNIEKQVFFFLQEGDLTREEEDEILEKINELNFYLQTLETRLDRHRDLVPIRYKMLLHHLQQNPHLTVLKGDN